MRVISKLLASLAVLVLATTSIASTVRGANLDNAHVDVNDLVDNSLVDTTNSLIDVDTGVYLEENGDDVCTSGVRPNVREVHDRAVYITVPVTEELAHTLTAPPMVPSVYAKTG